MTNLTEKQHGILRDMAERGAVVYHPRFVELSGETRMQFPDVPVDTEELRAMWCAGLVEMVDEQTGVTGERFRITEAGRSEVAR